jgi:hypothetical protein
MKTKILNFCQKHIYKLWLLLWLFCTILGTFIGLVIAVADDAPGAILIFGGIAFITSSLVCGIGTALTKILLDIREK